MILTVAQQQLIRSALVGTALQPIATRQQRLAIRQICAQVGPECEPEKLLIAFKSALVEAANERHLTYGIERNAMLSHLVSIFIEELYASANGENIPQIAPRNAQLATAPRLILEGDSPAAHL